MISDKTASDLQSIAKAGGGLAVDANAYTSRILKEIAAAGKTKKAKLIIHNSHSITANDMRAIAAASSGNVIFK